MRFTFNQKGAMFGLDGRVALSIFSILSVIAGASIFFNRLDSTASVMHSELKAIHTAIKDIQADLEDDFYASLDTPNSANAVLALFEDTTVTANKQKDWHGPYLDEFIQPLTRIYKSQNNVVGITTVSILKQPKQDNIDSSVACSGAAPCYYWVRIANLPLKLVSVLNNKVDGDAEALPDEEGRLQWIETSADVVDMWYLTERALDNNNTSLGE